MIFLQNTQVNSNFKSREKNQECHPSQGEVHLVANMLLLFSYLCNQYIQLHTDNFQLESLPHLHTLQTMNQDKNSTTSLLSSTPIRMSAQLVFERKLHIYAQCFTQSTVVNLYHQDCILRLMHAHCQKVPSAYKEQNKQATKEISCFRDFEFSTKKLYGLPEGA